MYILPTLKVWHSIAIGSNFNLNNLIMNIHYQAEVKVGFKQGREFEVTIVSDGEVITSEVFSNKTHHFEEMLAFIEMNENSGFDVFI